MSRKVGMSDPMGNMNASYGGAGKMLTQVVDAATSTTELYTWNADGTLASYPGLSYRRLLDYDEEQKLIRIKKDFGGGNIQTAYEYGYGADGGGRTLQAICGRGFRAALLAARGTF